MSGRDPPSDRQHSTEKTWEVCHYTYQKSLATLDVEIADPEITVKLEMRDVLKVHGEQT